MVSIRAFCLLVVKTARGTFEVIAGGRRLAALKLLAKRETIAKDEPVNCNVLGTEDAAEISLAENEMREAMHPADQFAAFKALIDAGHGPEVPALSATLLAELEAHRTAGLQAALAWQPELALRVMVHALATNALYSRYGETILALHTYPPALAAVCPGIADSPARQIMSEPRTYGAPGCPASMALSGDGCRTRTCPPCSA